MKKLIQLISITFLIFCTACIGKFGRHGFKTTQIIVDTQFYISNDSPRAYLTNFRGLGSSLTPVFSNTVNYKININIPTHFSIQPFYFLVKPGETYRIVPDKDNSFKVVYKGDKDDLRQKQLSEEFYERIRPLFPKNTDELQTVYNLETVLKREKDILKQFETYSNNLPEIIDSIGNILSMNQVQLNNANEFYSTKAFETLYYFYFNNVVTLRENNLLKLKLETLVPYLNSINKKNTFFKTNAGTFVGNIGNALMPIPKEQLNKEAEVESNLQFLNRTFSSIAKSYALAYVMDIAIDRKITISKKTYRMFFKLCKVKEYRQHIKNKVYEQKQLIRSQKKKVPNGLVDMKESKSDLKQLLKSNKDKVILLHYWASWCSPCIQDMPKLLDLERQIRDSNFVSISISIDQDRVRWKNMNTKMALNPQHSYCIDYETSQSFLDENIQAIPRYVLFDKFGNYQIFTDEILEKGIEELKNLILQKLKE